MTSELKPTVELWNVNDLVPYLKNAKKHPPEQIKNLAGQIKLRGWTQPIIIDPDGSIIGGHGRRLAALELGMTKVPVIVMHGLTADEVDAMRLADNRVSSNEYDTNLIQEEISRLYEGGFDLTMTAFNEKELEFLSTDLADFNEEAFVEDISSAVETQKVNNIEEQEKIDVSSAPLADAFGFKRLTVAQSRRVRTFIIRLENETGLVGAEALMKFFDQTGVP